MQKDVSVPVCADDARTAPRQAASVAVDAQGVVSAWSAGAREMFGYEPVEVVGKEAERLLADPLPAALRRCCAEREVWQGRIIVRHRDGRLLEVWLRTEPLWDAVGDVRWFLAATVPATAEPTAESAVGEPDAPVFEQWALEQISLPLALCDRRGRCFAANTAMARAVGRPQEELLGRHVGRFRTGRPTKDLEDIEETVEQVWRTGEAIQRKGCLPTPDEASTDAWLITLSPVRDRTGRVRAVSLAAADVTEQSHARRRLRVLNEAGVRIGTTLDLARTADELAEVGTDHFADFVLVDLLDSVLGGGDAESVPVGEGLVFRRVAQRSVLPGCPEAVVRIGARHSYHAESPPGLALAAGRAVRTAMDEAAFRMWAMGSPERARNIRIFGLHSMMAVPLRARGVTLGLAIFCRHRTPDPFDEEDLRLADELAARAAVYVDNARRYTREREIALTLQGTLLPDRAPRQAGVEMASRYLPADPSVGIGGDWFDVIPLSGARVALVVGDVVGHGIQASATMGRLCTAVRTLADVDLSPDELLTQLDDLVLRLDCERTASGTRKAVDGVANEVGATCLYAVYDPVSRQCSMARAGHPEPALVTPDGSVEFLHLPAGPPLGVGGLPFEVAEFEVPEGSVLALYTDGLIDSADRDADRGSAAFRDVLARQNDSLEETCDRAVRTLLPDVRKDDAALLLARTHALRAEQVATWELPADPAVVAQVRKMVHDQLAVWDLEHINFILELVVSELVTNAIRYGKPPVQLRLIRDTTLICEVSDGSSTSPHLRRARVFDEGGRGLLIVAQLTHRWGCRHTRAGKTIWAECTVEAV
ncbi:SpoIIE family protein phosphatase [Streptomyces sp. NPDC013178]|uniref:SpoIIE family protein phosphatase n=1 Tax=Streptomyces sp. NPDC013178 TaxID=3155118 RepID=UPI0034117F6C